MAKGDTIEVVYKTGVGTAIQVFTARQNGRQLGTRFEKDTGVNWFVVEELTRGGTIVAICRFKVEEVVAVIQRPEGSG